MSVSRADAQSGLYICVAKNVVGNVTLTMNVSWPHSSLARGGTRSTPQPVLPAPRWQPPTLSVINVAADYQLAPEDADVEVDEQERGDDDTRLFSVYELVAAVVGTHLCTVIAFLVILLPIMIVGGRRRARRAADDSLRVSDALLTKSSRSTRPTTVHTHHWPQRTCTVDYDVT